MLCHTNLMAQSSQRPNVIAYDKSTNTVIDSFPVEKLTHLIYSFVHLKGDSIKVGTAKDSLIIRQMVAVKKRNPKLKIMLALGGWGGCATCSEVFSTAQGRRTFAITTKQLLKNFNADGIDLDWEYPAVSGFPGHAYKPADKQNFTLLIRELRKKLGKNAEISFAAGGSENCLDSCFEWEKVMPLVNRVNIMSYDLVSGYATISGHHTPLYSTPQQELSADFAVQYLLKKGVPANKITLGAAFYARLFTNTTDSKQGLYQPTKFTGGFSYKYFDEQLSAAKGYTYHWDDVAKAPYCYNNTTKTIATFDDPKSIALKTNYVIDHHLNGIMFWELNDDRYTNGLLDVIDDTIKKRSKN
ncbi:MAG: glycoside hydrolase family 18 protein [Pedobacter sp.]|nr:glycoside hydrolase family 18 protein [Pedobacter sp.]